ncbi:MAG: DUF928 domain-containing protein [Spirulinaceae cyanobacterium SM2_1_0]|nr:DUF928 domain-containing protein [Spirulinaceae cyanobacterium SM2_1_0]
MSGFDLELQRLTRCRLAAHRCRSTSTSATTAAHPTFWLYIPATNADAFELWISDEQGETVYEQTVELPNAEEIGILELSFERLGLPALEPGQHYEWEFTLFSNFAEPASSTYSVVGKLERVELSARERSRLDSLARAQRLRTYEQRGLWHDMLAELVQLYRENPEDARIARHWYRTLNRAGLAAFADAKFTDWEFTAE